MSVARRAPGALPLLGHLPQFLRNQLGFLSESAKKYGDVVELALGGRTFLLAHPDDIAHVLVGHAANYSKSPRINSARGRRVGGVSLITSEGEEHQRLRRPLMPMMRQSVLEASAGIVVAQAAKVAAEWRGCEAVDVSAAMRKLALDCATRVVLGERIVELHPEIGEDVETRRRFMLAFYGSPRPLPELWPLPLNRRFWRARRRMTGVIDACMNEASSDPASMLGELCRSAPWTKGGVSREEMAGQFFTLLVSSYETLADFLAWLWWALGENPECQARVADELGRVSDTRTPTVREVMALDYTPRVIAEVLRLYPPTWLMVRIARAADRLPSGVELPAGAKIYLSQWVTHRDPRFFADPDRFDPSRFEPEQVRRRPAFAYFPFGGGARLCLGETLAKLTSQMMMATILPELCLTPVAQRRVEPLASVTLTSRQPILMRVGRRPEALNSPHLG